jgi:hypothetical protein
MHFERHILASPLYFNCKIVQLNYNDSCYGVINRNHVTLALIYFCAMRKSDQSRQFNLEKTT